MTACGSPSAVNNTVPPPGSATKSSPSPAPTTTPIPSPSTPKNGDYNAKGVVTKINLDAGSIELDHEEIVGVMPPMTMEFFVSDKKVLNGLKVGDKVDFVLRYKDHTETIVELKKAQ
jgi:Cu(I)/Ag(I) efflux system membrane protein CusA/SilA